MNAGCGFTVGDSSHRGGFESPRSCRILAGVFRKKKENIIGLTVAVSFFFFFLVMKVMKEVA